MKPMTHTTPLKGGYRIHAEGFDAQVVTDFKSACLFKGLNASRINSVRKHQHSKPRYDKYQVINLVKGEQHNTGFVLAIPQGGMAGTLYEGKKGVSRTYFMLGKVKLEFLGNNKVAGKIPASWLIELDCEEVAL